MPKVSVIIATYNCAPYIREALLSVLNQTYWDFEIIIIDDGSTDNTSQVIIQLGALTDKIRYIKQTNRGHAAARNAGIKCALGEYLAILDADDAWLPGRLKEGVELLDSQPESYIVHSNITVMTEEGKPYYTPQKKKELHSGYIFNNLFLQRAFISCSTVLFRKKACDEYGLFDENMARLSAEDRELWIRIAKHKKVEYIDKPLALYRMRRSGFSRDKQKLLDGVLYVINRHAVKGALKRKATANIYKSIGDEFIYEHNFTSAKRMYLKALLSWPWLFFAWINLGKSILKVKVKAEEKYFSRVLLNNNNCNNKSANIRCA